MAPNKRGEDGLVLILRGNLNSNFETHEWHAFHGFPVRFLKKFAASSETMSLKSAKNSKLKVQEIDVNEWEKLSEFDRLQLLNQLVDKRPKVSEKKAPK